MYIRTATLFLFAFVQSETLWAGQTYPDLLDAAIYNTYGGGGFFYPANCSVCHANKPENAANAVTDFGSNFTFIGDNLLATRPNLSNLTLTEMTTIMRGMAGYDPDSDGWTNEQEFGWDTEVLRFVNPSNPNDYFSNPNNAPPPGGGGGTPVTRQNEPAASSGASMGGCGMVAQESGSGTDNAAASGLLAWLLPLFLLGWYRQKG
ncbi:MAG: hypothetical protein ABL958_01365 [Bdellovibrionia bacterium]